MRAAKLDPNCGEAFRFLGDYFAGLDTVAQDAGGQSPAGESSSEIGSCTLQASGELLPQDSQHRTPSDDRAESFQETVAEKQKEGGLHDDLRGRRIRQAKHRDIGRAAKCYQRAVVLDPLDGHSGVSG